MSLDNLSGLPDWDEDDFNDEEEGEEWKPNPTRDACKAMYEQWKEVMTLLNAAFDTERIANDNVQPDEEDDPEKSFIAHSKGMILGDAFQVAVKIKSSEAGGLYMIRMENAGIIRKNAQFIKSNMLTMISEGAIAEEHGMLIRNEIDKFRMLFRDWVASFQKDEFEDEWGLY
jgi:hypothetical protein